MLSVGVEEKTKQDESKTTEGIEQWVALDELMDPELKTQQWRERVTNNMHHPRPDHVFLIFLYLFLQAKE